MSVQPLHVLKNLVDHEVTNQNGIAKQRKYTFLGAVLLSMLLTPVIGNTTQCQLLSQQNDCQGSSLWPVPAGWDPDDDGDCQPEPPRYISVLPPIIYQSSPSATGYAS